MPISRQQVSRLARLTMAEMQIVDKLNTPLMRHWGSAIPQGKQLNACCHRVTCLLIALQSLISCAKLQHASSLPVTSCILINLQFDHDRGLHIIMHLRLCYICFQGLRCSDTLTQTNF